MNYQKEHEMKLSDEERARILESMKEVNRRIDRARLRLEIQRIERAINRAAA